MTDKDREAVLKILRGNYRYDPDYGIILGHESAVEEILHYLQAALAATQKVNV
jgi:hypothetical protein